MIQSLLDPVKFYFDFSPVSKVDTSITNTQQFFSSESNLPCGYLIWTQSLKYGLLNLIMKAQFHFWVSFILIPFLISNSLACLNYVNALLMYKLKFTYLRARGFIGNN